MNNIAIIFYIVYSCSVMEKDKLKERRENLGLKQTDFAKEIGVTATSVSRWETGLVDIPKWMDLVFEALEARQIKKLQSRIENAN